MIPKKLCYALILSLLILCANIPAAFGENVIECTVDTSTSSELNTSARDAFRQSAQKQIGPLADTLFQWGEFESTPITFSAQDPIKVYSIRRSDGGFSLFLLNDTDSPETCRSVLNLSKGLYLVESSDSSRNEIHQLERCLGLGSNGKQSFSVTLDPKSMKVYRITDSIADSGKWLQTISDYSHQSGLTDKDTKKLSNCLGEAQSCLDQMKTRLGRTDRVNLTKYVHRALLVTSQAEAIFRNELSQGTLSTNSCPSLDSDLTHLRDSLSLLSMACFDLVPTITLQNPVKETDPIRVNLSLRNYGPKSVSLVGFSFKVPDGWTATTTDYTLFERLGPGESLSSEFAVGSPSNALVGSSITATADISYFSKNSAAHMNRQVIIQVPHAQ